jgi:glycerol-3-phosphate dehydrogenase
MNTSPKNRPSLDGQRFQVIVIGGGINGVAIARECARAQRRTLLVEQNDFCAGTTSRSTRLIHGGLRYLEYGEIGQVRESLRERGRLLRDRPHLVRPIRFLLALGKGSRRSALKVRLGLWLYRTLSRGTRFTTGGSDESSRFERLLDSGQEWSIFDFEDAQCEFPERLVAEWLVEAGEAGAEIRNHTQVLSIDVGHGRARGVFLRDLLTGKEGRVEGAWVVNATGPWVDQVCQHSRVNMRSRMISGVRGSHIVLPRLAGIPDQPVFAEAVDGRPIFLIPWNNQLLVGTTEVPDSSDPARTAPSSQEIEYLLKSIRCLFPQVTVSGADIHYAFSGVRPLPFTKTKSPSAVTRRHFLHDHANEGTQRLISVIGGKLTTAAALARACARKMSIPVADPQGFVPISGADLHSLVDEVAALPGVTERTGEAVAEWHGKRTLKILQHARSRADMRAPICPHSDHIVAEAVDALEGEYAVTLGDVLLRRVPVALGACWSEECTHIAAARIGMVLGWSESQTRSEEEGFEKERTAFLRKPDPSH